MSTFRMTASDDELRAWLGREEPEPVLEPELEIIDPHHHLWDQRACFAYSCNSCTQNVKFGQQRCCCP